MKFANNNINSDSVKAKSLTYYISRITTVLIVLFGVSYLIYQYNFSRGSDLIISTTLQNKTKIVLADGTKVFLNKNTKFSYPKNYNEETREVYLKGEAFFEVAHNEDLTFIVNTPEGGRVQELLITAFNVNTNSNGNTVVNVKRGAVALLSPYNLFGHVILDKGEMGELSGNSLTKSNSNRQNYLSWKTGILSYWNTPLEEVFCDLSEYYDTTIILKDSSLKLKKLTCLFNNKMLNEVLEKLKSSLNIHYLNTDSGILISKDN